MLIYMLMTPLTMTKMVLVIWLLFSFFLSVLLFLATGGKCLAVDLERNSDLLAEILLGGNLLEEGHVTAGQSLGARRVADAGGGVVA